MGFDGGLRFNSMHPDGTPRKLLDVTRINKLGWTAKISLPQGIEEVCQEYAATHDAPRTNSDYKNTATPIATPHVTSFSNFSRIDVDEILTKYFAH